MLDLHIHFPMHLLPDVEAPRDVVERMTQVRHRGDDRLRVAVLALAARALNFRHWETSWRVTAELLREGEVGVACSVLYRPFSELDLHESYSAPPESAYYAKLLELMDAVEAEMRRTSGTIVRTAADLETAGGERGAGGGETRAGGGETGAGGGEAGAGGGEAGAGGGEAGGGGGEAGAGGGETGAGGGETGAGERGNGQRGNGQREAGDAGAGIRYVHCIEGGFHLGATPEEVTAHVHELADRGVAYITLAHLFWRRVATNAPALPFLPDALYNRLFPQPPGRALSPLGEAALKAMYERRVLADISHMRQDAIDETFAIVEALDRTTGRAPAEYPIIASHSAYRFGRQRFNLTDGTISRIAARGGVIGLIFAQHQLKDGVQRKDTTTLDESLDLLGRHIDAIGPEHVAIGSDLDGFIKPTLGGIESAADLKPFAQALEQRYPETAQQMLATNALRVIRTRFASAGP